VWVASPIDLISEFLPVMAPLDDIVVVTLALRYAGRQVPREVVLAAWRGEPRLRYGYSAGQGVRTQIGEGPR
jgi:uncharacterized membrane protein YkvA (DUF1232 family)